MIPAHSYRTRARRAGRPLSAPLLRAALASLFILLLAGCRNRAPETETELVRRIDAALAGTARYLAARQGPDGAWRSETYGALRHTPDLTAYVMSSLFFMPQGGGEAQAAFLRGEEFILACVTAEGELRSDLELSYPVYTAASACRMAALRIKDERHRRAQRVWLEFLKARRLGRALGWGPEDAEFGGWGFCLVRPRKPHPGEFRPEFCEANLTATLFGVAALRSAKVPPDEPIYAEALSFVKRCQNFSDDPAVADPAYDDGGFFFLPAERDDVQNKAGAAGRDRRGRLRFRSYGTMTADGLRALVRCGLPLDHPRVAAARKWLELNFSAQENPGAFPPQHRELRNATYYYWAWAAVHALQIFQSREIETSRGKTDWAAAFARELLARRRSDGAWVNRATDAKEDDPLVASPWAAAALAVCRAALTGEDRALFPRPENEKHPATHSVSGSLD